MYDTKGPYRVFLWYWLGKYQENTNQYHIKIPNRDRTLEIFFFPQPLLKLLKVGLQLLQMGSVAPGVVHANVGQNVTPHNPSLGLFLYHFLHTMVS